jgi:hypothetical protein
MKKVLLFFLGMCLLTAPCAGAEDFLGAPVFPGVETVTKTEDRLVVKTSASHADVVSFYKEALKDLKDIKFRDWKEDTYIEDDGNRPWHSITIPKGDAGESTITIGKDNWTWIIGTLTLRFVGVFVVLMCLYLGLSLSGKIIPHTVKKMKTK